MKGLWKKTFVVLLTLVMVAGIAAACGSGSNDNGSNSTSGNTSSGSDAANNSGGNHAGAGGSAGEKPYAGTEIRLIMATHPWLDTIREMLPEFEEKTGIKVQVESYSQEQTSQKISVELVGKSSSLDVIFIRPLDETKLFGRNGWLEPLESYVANDPAYDLDDFIPSALDTARYQGELLGIPITTEREILYYRKDLFEQRGLSVPTTMEELREVAAALHDPANNLYGFASRGRKNVAVTQFAGYLYSFGGQFQDGDTATLNTPEALAAYEFYGDMLRNYGPPGAVNMHWTEIAAAFAQGQIAMFTDADAIYTNVADPEKSTVSDQVGYAMFPAGPAGAKPYNVASGALAISKFSQKKEAAAEFIKWATSKEIVLRTQAAGNPGARQSVWNDPESTKNYPADLVEVINKTAEIGVGVDRPQVINVGEARDLISEPITAAIMGLDIKEAADRAQQAFQELIDRENAEAAQ
jgi:multiple sugar transport system substrate-binding protein